MASSLPTPASPPPSAGLPVGREREMAALRRRLAALRSGRGGLVLIAGDAGIGKSALVHWFAAAVEAAGARLLAGYCVDLAQTPPYGPWRDALAALMSADDASPEIAAFAADALTSQSDLFERVRADLASAASRQPLAIALEDMHWSDPASLDLLRFIAHGVRSLPLLLLVTYRADEIAPRQPLFALLPHLAREPDVERLTLGALDDEATRALVRHRYALSGPDESRLATYLQLRADGNPLFIAELLRTLESERLLAAAPDGWRLGELSQTPVPPLIRQIIEERLTRLPPERLPLLEIASTIGQEVPIDISDRGR